MKSLARLINDDDFEFRAQLYFSDWVSGLKWLAKF
jgi:hypothetical protein